ncbi:MAG TPA: spore germination protein GerW family protein [Thermoanaerobaculia bacterium]|nr:spore germination protein GerW family protein [Thermoanaerobaculia bacterium]
MPENSLVERIGEVVQVHANARQVYGEPVERGGLTIIPVARVQWGFGGGGIGHGALERGGGGGGARATPAGYIEVRDGQAEYRPIHDLGGTAPLIAGVVGVIAGLLIGRALRK